MILVSNPSKIYTSYALKLSERLKILSNFPLHCFLLKYIKSLCFLQRYLKVVLYFSETSLSPGGTATITFGERNTYV